MPIINLLPSDIREAQSYARFNRSLINLGTRLAVGFGLMIVVFILQIALFNEQKSSDNGGLSDATASLTRYASLEREAGASNRALTQFAAIRASHPYWDRFFQELASKTPSSVYLTGIASTPPPAQELVVNGDSRDFASVTSFVEALKSSSRFTGVKIDSITPDSDSVGFAKYNFTIRITLSPGAFK
jgi:Tfp pilus assembly protein PilN